jgi:hypothetical protein
MTVRLLFLYCLTMMKDWQHTGAFVIQFQAETDISQGQFEGRIEHIASCKTTQFQSLDEFLSFVSQVMTQVRAHPQERF